MENHLYRKILLTCEHATNAVPERFRHLFAGNEVLLKTHLGWDPGALHLAEMLSKELNVPLFFYPYTRLLIEPNRSIGHPLLFSEFSRSLPDSDKEKLYRDYYLPYRNRIQNEIVATIKAGSQAVHVGIHSFAPVLDGKERDVDIGLLYDPQRSAEKTFCREWQKRLRENLPDLRVRLNRPYKGASDGFATALRKSFSEANYLGIELEANQKIISGKDEIQKAGKEIARALSNLIDV
jgi:predicted N-formylglutamate amidohydrolase